MFAAHMDEVGFLVRNISDIGFLILTPLGGVLDKAKENQIVRVTNEEGQKFEGLLNVTKNSKGEIEQMYVDLGLETRAEVETRGIDIGDMVCFASTFKSLVADDTFAGKAMDDRVGCFALIEAMKALSTLDIAVNIVAAFTSSEEVGTRGGKTSSTRIKPDLFFAVDVANHPELDRSYLNSRKLGQGPMIVHYDKTMVPNRQLLKEVKGIFESHRIPYQKDMLKGGGTDAALAHLEKSGTPAMVIGIPLRYCHGPYSFVNMNDAKHASLAIEQIAKNFNSDLINQIYKF